MCGHEYYKPAELEIRLENIIQSVYEGILVQSIRQNNRIQCAIKKNLRKGVRHEC